MKKYYLNNPTAEAIHITLSTARTIEPMSSLSLNNKDVEMFKKIRAARMGKVSFVHALRLSTIRIEDDSNFAPVENKGEHKENKIDIESLPEKCRPCYADNKVPTEQDCEECKAKEDLEAKEKADEEAALKAKEIEEAEAAKALEAKRAEVKKMILKEAKKAKKEINEDELEAAIDAYIAEEAKAAIEQNADVAEQLGE